MAARRLALISAQLRPAGPPLVVPAAGAVPFVPEPIAPGGVVLPLFEPASPLLDQSCLHEPESYNHREPSAEASDPVRTVVGIHNPSIEAHILPPGPQNSGSCVIVVPGGGHGILVIGSEGADCVPFFANYGISTVILRERLRVDGYNMVTDAMDDTFQAIRLVRSHATEWGLDPNKIGIMGFSAGAELAAAAAIEYDAWNAAHADTPSATGDALGSVSCRPDFIGLLYPGPTPFQTKESREITGCTRLQGGGWGDDRTSEPDPVRPDIPRDVPPSFIATPSSGDRIHAIWAAEYFCEPRAICPLLVYPGNASDMVGCVCLQTKCYLTECQTSRCTRMAMDLTAAALHTDMELLSGAGQTVLWSGSKTAGFLERPVRRQKRR